MEWTAYQPEILDLELDAVTGWDLVYFLGMRCVLCGNKGHQHGNLVTRKADYGISG